MAAADSQNQNIFVYPQSTVERAERSLVCSPFNLSLFEVMGHQSVSLTAIALDNGLKQGYTKRPLSELACDNALGWLIQVGVLRREVDGQGITDSFRLTPLGSSVSGKIPGKKLADTLMARSFIRCCNPLVTDTFLEEKTQELGLRNQRE